MAAADRPAPATATSGVPPFRVLISGASGFIGSELVRQLEEDGHTVLRLVRGTPRSASESNWDPSARRMDSEIVESVDAVINLSGASTGRLPWTRAYQREILESRTHSTETLAQAMLMAEKAPRVFLSGSAVGFYGDRPAERLTEQSTKGEGFFPDVVEAWESAARLAPEGTRVVSLRTGLVVGRGGAFTPLIPLTRFGLGSRFGTGGQHWPWISRYDEAAAIRHLLKSSLTGPVNLVGPTPATSDRVTRYLAKALSRRYPFVIPSPVIDALLGIGGHELLLPSQKVLPAALIADGFRFRHPTVESAIDDEIVRTP